ncbi:GNAT family N-acetyltransferase [Candidatus Micrarchaeota archaeon]|nr:GNAT family N-acetyltransferase [Candidatus Micrarchaeota archaeon]
MITNRQKTGSIGAAWPPSYGRRNNRIKGFCPFKVEDKRLFDRLKRDIGAARSTHPGATRTTVRAFMASGIADAAPGLEARFPADRIFPGLELVYLGFNSNERKSRDEILGAELDSVGQLISSNGQPSPRKIFERVAGGGYSVTPLNGARTAAVGQLLELYNEAYQEYTFEINSDTISNMLNNGNIVLVGRGPDSTIVSSLIAEHAAIEVDGKQVHLYELSDYATLRAHRGNGLMTAMQVMAVEAIRSLEHGQESIIYAEDRAAWEAVNISSHRAGLAYCGTLQKHCVLVSDRTFPEEGRLENLNVWVSP